MKSFEILLVEDNLADVGLVRRALKEHCVDCALHVIHDGEEAIQWIDSRDTRSGAPRLDLVLMDMHLPKLDGEDILEHLRATENLAQTPVVLMSSLDSSSVSDQAKSHAMLVHFRKPTTLDEFMQLGSITRRILHADERFVPDRSPGEGDAGDAA